jgi:hypothetical protein
MRLALPVRHRPMPVRFYRFEKPGILHNNVEKPCENFRQATEIQVKLSA